MPSQTRCTSTPFFVVFVVFVVFVIKFFFAFTQSSVLFLLGTSFRMRNLLLRTRPDHAGREHRAIFPPKSPLTGREHRAMRYEDMFIGILIITLLIIAAVRILSPKNPAPTRELFHDSEGKLVAIGDHSPSVGHLSGQGSLTSAPLQLAAGSYRIDYQFDALTRLALLDSTGEETVFIRRGAGTEPLEILEAGRYRLLIEPTDEGATWQVSYRQMR
jgi:hypothetical protein